jgi:DNA (cytosine-5)-methyltransferase 1
MGQAVQALPAGTLTVGSMFAGVGGICSGFNQAGFTVAWANERDRHACTVYRANFPTQRLVEGDINDISPADLGPVDVLTSGFPCQPFSVAATGYRLGFKDPAGRGNLFFTTARFIEDLRPRAFLLENVRGLVGHDGGQTFRTIRDLMTRELGYSFRSFLLNAARHGNTPQHRERIFMIGFRGEAEGGQMTDAFRIPKPIPLIRTIHDCLSPDRPSKRYYLPDGHKRAPLFWSTRRSRNTVYQLRRSYVRENKSLLCPTLTANMGSGGNNVPFIFDEWGIRRLTPRECFNFQGFPKDFVFPSGMADCHLYHQAGNSVAVPVIRRIAEEIKRVLAV